LVPYTDWGLVIRDSLSFMLKLTLHYPSKTERYCTFINSLVLKETEDGIQTYM